MLTHIKSAGTVIVYEVVFELRSIFFSGRRGEGGGKRSWPGSSRAITVQ